MVTAADLSPTWIDDEHEIVNGFRYDHSLRRGIGYALTDQHHVRGITHPNSMLAFPRNVHVTFYRRTSTPSSESRPLIEPSEEVEELFTRLATEWREATKYMSVELEKTSHPAYLQIIGMGPVAVPLILRQVESSTAHWFRALRAITRLNVAEGSKNLAEVRDAWLAWGRKSHLL
jgi:hypothetical protein